MSAHNDEVARLSQLRQDLLHCAYNIVKLNILHILRMGGCGRFFGRESHNSKPYPFNPDHSSLADIIEWQLDVRREHGESCLTYAVSDCFQSIIEFMIPKNRCAVAHPVHHGHHGFTVV